MIEKRNSDSTYVGVRNATNYGLEPYGYSMESLEYPLAIFVCLSRGRSSWYSLHGLDLYSWNWRYTHLILYTLHEENYESFYDKIISSFLISNFICLRVFEDCVEVLRAAYNTCPKVCVPYRFLALCQFKTPSLICIY